MIEITRIDIQKNDSLTSNVKAFANIVINNCFVVNGLKIIQGQSNLFVAMPSRKTDDGYADVVHPINGQTRDLINSKVLAEYINANN